MKFHSLGFGSLKKIIFLLLEFPRYITSFPGSDTHRAVSPLFYHGSESLPLFLLRAPADMRPFTQKRAKQTFWETFAFPPAFRRVKMKSFEFGAFLKI